MLGSFQMQAWNKKKLKEMPLGALPVQTFLSGSCHAGASSFG